MCVQSDMHGELGAAGLRVCGLNVIRLTGTIVTRRLGRHCKQLVINFQRVQL
jgi:hypothetical protein